MKFIPCSSDLYKRHRKNFMKSMERNSMAIFFGNSMPFRTADTYFSYRQQSDLFYLTGIEQEDTILVLFPDAPEEQYKEILFTKETSEEIAIWEGRKNTKEQSTDISGIKNIQRTSKSDKTISYLMNFADAVYGNLNENIRSYDNNDLNKKMIISLKEKFPLHLYKRCGPILKKLRMVKSEEEVKQIRKACDITNEAFNKVLKTIKPGIMEYQIEAEISREFLWNGASGHAYTPVIASGYNACVLHYISNDNKCSDGELVLMDFGCEYGNYTSDCTRCIPVNGKFSHRQAEIYDAVLHVQREAMKLLTVGKTILQYHKEVGDVMSGTLVKLGLLSSDEVESTRESEHPAYKKYFMHGTSHHLGLDVHDHGDFYTPIQAGMVFTVEPGIYIPDENLGIRLENNVLITENGYEDLMKDIPIERREIEALMCS